MDRPERGEPSSSPWSRPPAHKHYGRRLLILGGAIGGGLILLLSAVPPTAWSQGEQIDIARIGIIGIVFLISAAASRRSLASIAGGLAAWGVIGLALVMLYGYRFELHAAWDRVASELMPAAAQEAADGSLSFARGSDGHFHIDAIVDGQPIRFLVDTGATGVALTRADAARLGYAADRLRFTQTVQTANGTTRGMPIQLHQVRIGPLAFDDVPASINEGELGQSLLGMRLLERLSSIEIKNDRLVIHR